MKRLPNKVSRDMTEIGIRVLLDRLTSERKCYKREFEKAVEHETLERWSCLAETRRDLMKLQELVERQSKSNLFLWKVRRKLRDDEDCPAWTHLVSGKHDEHENHWDDEEWMFKHRHIFVPNGSNPAVAIVVANFDQYATSAALERIGKSGAGVNLHTKLAAADALGLDVLSDEAAAEIGASCGEASLVATKHMGNPAFERAYLRVVNG